MDDLLSCMSLPVIYASALETITNHQSVPVWRVNGPRPGLKDTYAERICSSTGV